MLPKVTMKGSPLHSGNIKNPLFWNRGCFTNLLSFVHRESSTATVPHAVCDWTVSAPTIFGLPGRSFVSVRS